MYWGAGVLFYLRIEGARRSIIVTIITQKKMSLSSVATIARRYRALHFSADSLIILSRHQTAALAPPLHTWSCQRHAGGGFRRIFSTEGRPHPQQATINSSPQKFPSVSLIAGVFVVSSLLASLVISSSSSPISLSPRVLSNDSSPINKSELASSQSSGRTDIFINRWGGEGDLDDGGGVVPTGTSKVPFFPRNLFLPRPDDNWKSRSAPSSAGLGSGGALDTKNEEYVLLGLGIRTVSFLSIQVYVVGLYVAVSDLARLQECMVRSISTPTRQETTSLVGREKEDLSRMLADAKGSEQIWGEILKQNGIKTALRIVPTRSSGFGHLRDGWVRGIAARGKKEKFEDEDFAKALGNFKSIFGGTGMKGLEVGKGLLLLRGEDGALRVCLEKANNSDVSASRKGDAMALMGIVKDERISRLLWLGYLAGGSVASEEARRSMIEGVMEIVERPRGTLEGRVI